MRACGWPTSPAAPASAVTWSTWPAARCCCAPSDPFYAALALIELDGVARRIVLCPPDLADGDLPLAAETAGVDAVVFDGALPPLRLTDALFVSMRLPLTPLAATPKTHTPPSG